MSAPRLTFLTLAVLTTGILSGCGGGGSGTASAPVAAAPMPPVVAAPAPAPAPVPLPAGVSTLSGTVTGFGSVIVDGVRIDDSKVSAGKETEDDSVKQVELKLGQHVEIQHDGKLLATRLRVGANAEGSVSAVNAAAGTLTVAGQNVTVNTDAALGPVTVFEGYASLAAVQANDRVEVHGLIKTDSAGKTSVQATRIEKTTAAGDTADRINGLVADLSASAHTFKLGGLVVDYGTAKIMPEGTALANGAEVKVAVPIGTVAGATAVKAVVVKLRDRKAEAGGKEAELGGAISAVDPAKKTITVAGVSIDVAAARYDQPGTSLADLKPNAYVVVKGTYGSDGGLKAATVILRGVGGGNKEIELHGTVVRFASVAGFAVRDVQVDATGVTLDAATCGSLKLGNDLQVEVRGTLAGNGQVKASSISCERATDDHVVLSREGVAANVDPTAQTFTLTMAKETITVKWSNATLFRSVEIATLAGKKVEIEGSSSNGVFTATKIKAEGK